MMNANIKNMDAKSKIRNTKLYKIAIQVLLVLSYIGYFSSLYRGMDRNVSTYTNYIIIIVCLGSSLFEKPDKDNKALYALTVMNSILLVSWIVATVVQLVI